MRDFLSGIVDRLATIFDPARMGAAAAELLANVLIGLVTFAAYYGLWRILHVAFHALAARTGMDATSRDFTRTLLKFAVLAMGLVSALAAVGLNTASLLTSLGVAGLTLGFFRALSEAGIDMPFETLRLEPFTIRREQAA